MTRFTTALVTILLAGGSARAAGLLAPTDQTLPPLRVTDHFVDAEIHDRVALTTVTQTFHNDTNRRLEATYVFPLPEDADLTNFQMTFNGKLVEGEVLPADDARRIYEQIVRQTRDPGLIEFIGRRLLRMRVFPIEPGSDTTIKLRYQQVARHVSGMQAYHYPLRTREAAGQAYGMVRFTVALHTNAPLKNVWSPSHAVEIVRQGEHDARIAYEASGGSLQDDFLLLYGTDDSDLGLSVVAHRPDASEPGYFVAMLTPKQLWPEASRQAQDVVFVIDTSGSMAGAKIDQARRALSYCIDQLDEGDRFNVVRFSTGFDQLFGKLAAATKENRGEAQNFAESFRAAGGTNIADTLTHVVGLRDADETRPFVVVFLTDGQGNREPDEILEAMKAVPGAAEGVRIFSFGVGHDVNTVLLDRLANEYGGRPTYVQPGENLELVLGDFFSVVSQPVLVNLKLTFPEIGVTEQFPPTLGDLYHGQQLIIAGRFRKSMTSPVTLSATRNGERVEFAWPDVAFLDTPQASYVPAVWAGRKISYLVDQIRQHGENKEMIAEIVALSQAHGIQTPYTSWLVAPERQGILLGRARRGIPGPAPQLPATAARRAAQSAPSGGGFGAGGGALYGDDDGAISLDEAAEKVTAASGNVANLIARKNAALRDMNSRDQERLDTRRLPVLRLGDRWYHRLGAFLVDQDVDEQTEILEIRFASDAWFELVEGLESLRPVLAESRDVIAVVRPGLAVMVSGDAGIEEFSPAQRKQIGLPAR